MERFQKTQRSSQKGTNGIHLASMSIQRITHLIFFQKFKGFRPPVDYLKQNEYAFDGRVYKQT